MHERQPLAAAVKKLFEQTASEWATRRARYLSFVTSPASVLDGTFHLFSSTSSSLSPVETPFVCTCTTGRSAPSARFSAYACLQRYVYVYFDPLKLSGVILDPFSRLRCVNTPSDSGMRGRLRAARFDPELPAALKD